VTARDVIEGYLAELRENLAMLEPLRAIPLDEYRGDRPRQKVVERCLQVAIECMIDIADHLVSEHAWRRPVSAEEALDVLSETGVLPGPYRERIRGIAGFRNVLVHGYVRLDPRRVHAYLQRLDDLRDFGRHVQAFLDREPTA